MKGQFFIISTVIMISALILITQYLYDYSKVDLTKIEQMQELNYINDITNSLNSTVLIACDNGNDQVLEKDLSLVEQSLKSEMLEKGIVLTITHPTISCTSMTFTFTMKNSEFNIEKTFSV